MAWTDYADLTRDELIALLIQRDHTILDLQQRVQILEQNVKRLEDLLDQARRGGKRQAAPFSKNTPKANTKPPGRKPGDAYGRQGHRQPPTTPPDEIIDVPLPRACPDCGGSLEQVQVAQQHQIELPRKPIHRRFDLHIGRCTCCGRRHQPRHPLQTSDALGAAAVQLGAHAQAFVALMKNKFGLSYGDITGILWDWFRVPFTRGGGARLVQRVGRKIEPVYDRLKALTRLSDMVCPDETGWRVGGVLNWLHVYVTRQVTLYVIRASRGRDVPQEILGPDYAGRMTHDGWAPYDAFTHAAHQQCLRHLFNRCKELTEQALGRARQFSSQLADVLHRALQLRDRRDEQTISPHGLATARGLLETCLDRLLGRRLVNAGNRRLAKFLRSHRGQVLAFLYDPGLEPTNWRGEQAIRPVVVNRKVFGGNRTPAGAHALEVQASVIVTCQRNGVDACRYLSNILLTPPSDFGSPPFIPMPFVYY